MSETVILVGHDNFVPSEKILAILNKKTNSVKPFISKAELSGKLLDATSGKAVKSVILTTDFYVVLSSIQPKTLAKRYADETSLPITSCGGDNHIPNNGISAILQINSLPLKEMIKQARANERVVSMKMGHKTKSIIVTSVGYLFLSFIEPKTLARKQFAKNKNKQLAREEA